MCEICSKLITKIPEQRQCDCSGVRIVLVSDIFMGFPLLIWTSKSHLGLLLVFLKYIKNDINLICKLSKTKTEKPEKEI